MRAQKNSKNNPENCAQTDRPTELEQSDKLLTLYNLGLEDEAWQKIVKALAARGYPLKDDDLRAGRR